MSLDLCISLATKHEFGDQVHAPTALYRITIRYEAE